MLVKNGGPLLVKTDSELRVLAVGHFPSLGVALRVLGLQEIERVETGHYDVIF